MAEEPNDNNSANLKIDGNLIKWTLGVASITLVVGFIAFLLLNWAFAPVSGLELLKVILTVIAGLGGVVYLVVHFRTQIINEADDRRKEVVAKREEEQFIEDKLFSAFEMLGAEAPSTKIAGIFALTDISDTYGGHYKQRVVDILCGYLRTPREKSELPVETTIISAILKRTTSAQPLENAEQIERNAWSNCSINLDGAHMWGDVFFDEVKLSRPLSMSGCVFERHVYILRCDIENLFSINSLYKYGIQLYENFPNEFVFRNSRFGEGYTYIDHKPIDLRMSDFESQDNVHITGYSLKETFDEEQNRHVFITVANSTDSYS